MKPSAETPGKGVSENQSKREQTRSPMERERDLWAVPDSLVEPLYRKLGSDLKKQTPTSRKSTGYKSRSARLKEETALQQARKKRF